MSRALHVVILAAGEGKRMKSKRPKVLQAIAGKPMLGHVVDAARALEPDAIHIVHGHASDQVQAAFAAQGDLHWAEQASQLGTGHAVQQAMPGIPDDSRVLVLYGDVPLIRSESLRILLDSTGVLGVLAAHFRSTLLPMISTLPEASTKKSLALTMVTPSLSSVSLLPCLSLSATSSASSSSRIFEPPGVCR